MGLIEQQRGWQRHGPDRGCHRPGRTGGGTATITYAPLIRDGGARLNRRFTLYDLTRSRDVRAASTPDSTLP